MKWWSFGAKTIERVKVIAIVRTASASEESHNRRIDIFSYNMIIAFLNERYLELVPGHSMVTEDTDDWLLTKSLLKRR